MILNRCPSALAVSLRLIFKRYIEEERKPNAWRDANITPIFKKGCRLNHANYRRVSFTSVVCRVLERMIRDRFLIN